MRDVEFEDYYRMNYVGMPDYCKKANAICYTVTKPQKRSYRQSIVLKNQKDGREETIHAGGEQETFPRFCPQSDEKAIILAFLSDADGQAQIYRYDSRKKSCEKLTDVKGGVREFTWSLDGTKIAFLAGNGDTQEKGRTPFDPIIIEDYGYRADESMGFVDRKRDSSQLWILSVEDKTVRQLTRGEADYVMPVWMPDSKSLLVTSNKNRERKESIGMDLYRIDAATGEMETMTEDMWIAWYPKSFPPLISRDGSFAVIGAFDPKALSKGNLAIHLYRLDISTKKVTDLWPEDAPCHEATCFLYNGENYGGFGSSASLGKEDHVVYFISGWHGEASIYEADVNHPHIVKSDLGKGFLNKGTFRFIGTPKDGMLLAARGDFSETAQLYLLNENGEAPVKVTDTDAWMRETVMSIPKEMWISTLDGKGKVQGFVMEPHHREEGKTYPAVLYIHGGPTPFYGFALTYEFQLLAAAGIGVIFCNPRGSSGYGPEHGSMKYAYDQTAMYDLLQFTEEAGRKYPWIDKKRLGVTGGSYGGYMTNWLAGHTKVFRAAVTQRSIGNELIQYASSDMAGSSKEYGDFTDFMKEQIRKSPVAYADQISIPFLILHSTGDMRCPVEQAHQLYVAVKDTHPDLPVRLVLFPDSNHELTMSGVMELRIAHYKEMVKWFKQYL